MRGEIKKLSLGLVFVALLATNTFAQGDNYGAGQANERFTNFI
jgi:hypothetical protein